MAYAFQDDCGGRSWHDRINGAFPVVDIPTIVSAVEQHLSISEWERDR
jgi:sulfur transfer complex TusBCD TusB component (DsrH family)